MNHLPVYNNKTPLSLSKDEREKTEKIINEILDNLNFFRLRLDNQPNLTDVHTHLGLAEYQLQDLAKLTNYSSVLLEEQARRHTEIKEKNTEIHRLTQLLGDKELSPEEITAKLRLYDDTFRLFYGACSFRYADLKQYNTYGILYEVDDELQYDQDDGCSSRKNWKDYFWEQHSLITNNPQFDLYKDTYSATLLDTDNNRQTLQKHFKRWFPNIQFYSFKGLRNDYNSYSLRFTIHLSYTDLDAYLRRTLPETEKTTTERTNP